MSHRIVTGLVRFAALAILLTSLSLFAAVPHGWLLEGTKPANYEVAVDHDADYSNYSSAVLRAKQPNVDGFGTLMQQFRADAYCRKRVCALPRA